MASPAKSFPHLSALAIGSAIIAVASFLVGEIADLDIFWNVAIGDDILAHRSVPHFDRYTAAGFGHPYHDIHWFFQVLAAIAHTAGGWTGVELLQIAIWAFTLALLFHLSWKAAGPLIATVLVVCAAVTSAERFIPRPEIVTFLSIAVFLYVLQQKAYRRPWGFVLLVVMQLVWSNAHGLFVVGPFLVALYATEAMIERRSPDVHRLLQLLLSCLAVSVLTPYGARNWNYAWMLVSQVGPHASPLMRSIGELSPTFGPAFRHSPAFWAFLLLLGITAVSVVFALVRRRSLPIALLLNAIVMAALAFTGRRNVVLFALAAVPLVAELSGSIEPLQRWARSPVAAIAVSLCCVAIAAYPLSGLYYLQVEIPSRFGLGVTPSFFPHGLHAFLERIGFQGQVYNSNTIGGFYLANEFPRRLPLTEGRWTAYEEAEVTSILDASADAARFATVVQKYSIAAVLLQHASVESRRLVPRLVHSPEWRLVYYDYAASFWLRRGVLPAVPAIDLGSGCALDLPRRVDDAIMIDLFFRDAGALRARLDNLARASSFGWKREDFLGGLAALQLETGDLAAAEATNSRIAAEFPRNAAARNELAWFAFRRGDIESARTQMRAAILLDPRNTGYAENLARVERAWESTRQSRGAKQR